MARMAKKTTVLTFKSSKSVDRAWPVINAMLATGRTIRVVIGG